MVALLRFLEHGKVGVHLGAVLEGGAVDALELRVFLVAFVVGAGDVGELEGTDVARAHDVRAGAEIGEFAVAIEGNFLALGNVLNDVEFELRGGRSRTKGTKDTKVRHFQGFVSGDSDALEGVIRLRFLFHLGFDLREVLGRDAVRQFEIVIEAILDRRPGGKLRLRPDAQDRGRHDVRGGMAQPLEVGHLRALLGSFAFVGHGNRVGVG